MRRGNAILSLVVAALVACQAGCGSSAPKGDRTPPRLSEVRITRDAAAIIVDAVVTDAETGVASVKAVCFDAADSRMEVPLAITVPPNYAGRVPDVTVRLWVEAVDGAGGMSRSAEVRVPPPPP